MRTIKEQSKRLSVQRKLRATNCAIRGSCNANVTGVRIRDQKHLDELNKRSLHERFPQLRNIVILDRSPVPNPYDPAAARSTITSINAFSVGTLSRLPNLSSLDLYSCDALPVGAALQALTCCTKLQELMLPSGVLHRP